MPSSGADAYASPRLGFGMTPASAREVSRPSGRLLGMGSKGGATPFEL